MPFFVISLQSVSCDFFNLILWFFNFDFVLLDGISFSLLLVITWLIRVFWCSYKIDCLCIYNIYCLCIKWCYKNLIVSFIVIDWLLCSHLRSMIYLMKPQACKYFFLRSFVDQRWLFYMFASFMNWIRFFESIFGYQKF